MDQRRAAGALLALVVCIASTAAAPTVSNQTGLDLYDGAVEGCYYNFQHYGEGDRIMTNEPCLNCTCHNRMLMCYLRVCPFTKPIGQDCTVEKRADQCCPIVTCPDVPVDLLTSTSTTSPAEYGATGVGKLDKYGCSINGKYFPEGSKVPPTPNKPCEHCYCIRNMTTCVMQECTLHVDGCTPIYHKDVCCPVRYSCDHPEDSTLLLDDMTTTVRPTPGFLLTTTTLSPVTQMSQDCVHDDQIFPDGALIKTEKACEHCYCMKGDIVCVVQECGTPMENEGKNCTSQPPREGQCCPDTYICEGDDVTTEPSSEFTTEHLLEELTTLSPPRRVGVEGSGYRNEPDEPAFTEVPSMETESEGSGYEQSSEPAVIDDTNILTPEMPEMTSESLDESLYTSRTTVRTPILEEVEKTTEPDKGLNTVPSDEEIYKPSVTEKTPSEEPSMTGTTLTSDEKEDESDVTATSPKDVSMPVLTSKSEDGSSTTESAFRKEDMFGEPTEMYELGEPEKVSTQAPDIEKERDEDDTSSKTKAPFMEELEKHTTLSPESTQKDIEQEPPSKEPELEVDATTSADVMPTERISTTSVELSPSTTASTIEKVDVTESTSHDLNEIDDILTTLAPGRIPGEGDCLLNDITYRNNSDVPSSNICHTGCRCVSSIIKCDPIICSPPPEYMDNCQPTYDSPDSCCPTYVCHTGETMPPQPHSQMSGTDSPLPSHPIECNGDECEVRKEDKIPVAGDCGSAGCGEDQAVLPETSTGDCHDGQCSLPAQPCKDGNCQETPETHCADGKCGIEPEIVPVKHTPLCDNESDCKGTAPEQPACEGEGCINVNVGCSGTDCDTGVIQEPASPGKTEESCEGDCKAPEGELVQPCTETSCRRKETGDVQTSLPSDCSGSECSQQMPLSGDNEQTAGIPVTEETGIKSTEQFEITTARQNIPTESPVASEAASEHSTESSLDVSVPEASEQPASSGTESPSQLDHTTESHLDSTDKVTKLPQVTEEELQTSEPEVSVTDEIRISDTDSATEEIQEPTTEAQESLSSQSPDRESQDITTKSDTEESLQTETTHGVQRQSTESPQVTEVVRTVVPQDVSTSVPNILQTESSIPHEQDQDHVDKVTEEPVPYTPESDLASTHLPEVGVTESNEITDKVTEVPEPIEKDEHKTTIETIRQELTTEEPSLLTGPQEPESDILHTTAKDIEQPPFTNAPTESHLDAGTSPAESVTEKVSETSTAKTSEDTLVTTGAPEIYKTEKQEPFTEYPGEYITESQELGTKKPAEADQESTQTETPEYSTEETMEGQEETVSEDDSKLQTTSAAPTDIKEKDTPSSETQSIEEGTTQSSVLVEKTTISEPVVKPEVDEEKTERPVESPEMIDVTQDTTQEPTEKPAASSTIQEDKTITETPDTLETARPSQVAEHDYKTDAPEQVTESEYGITEPHEISTDEPTMVSIGESPVTEKIPSEPYIPVYPQETPETATEQHDIINEIPDEDLENQTPSSIDEVEKQTKFPDRSGLDEATEEPGHVDPESPDVRVPDISETQPPEVYTETPDVEKMDEGEQPQITDKQTAAPEDFATKEDLETKGPETYTTRMPVYDVPVTTQAPEIVEKETEMASVTTEKVKEQPSEEQEPASELEKYSTVSVVQETTAPSVQQEGSEQPAEVTESEISYSTSAPESHVKEPQETITESAETFTTESHYAGVTMPQEKLTPDEAVTEGVSEEKPFKETDMKPEEKPELPQDSYTRKPEEASTVLLEEVTEPSAIKPQEEDQKLPVDIATDKPEHEEPSVDESSTRSPIGLDAEVTEPSQDKETQADLDKATTAVSSDEQESVTAEGGSREPMSTTPSPQDISSTPLASEPEQPDKYTVTLTQETTPGAIADAVTNVSEEGGPHEAYTGKPEEVEDVDMQRTTLKTPDIDTETQPEQATQGYEPEMSTGEPAVYDAKEPDTTEKTSITGSPAEVSTDDQSTIPDFVELEEHSHKPVDELSTVAPTDEELITKPSVDDEERQEPNLTTESPVKDTDTDEGRLSTPSSEYSPEVSSVTIMDRGESPAETTLPPSEEVAPTTGLPGLREEDQKFGEDTSEEASEKPTQASPESEHPTSDTEIPVQTEKVPTEQVTESDLSHETTMLEEVSPVTVKVASTEEDESLTEKPVYVEPEEKPLDTKPEEKPEEQPLEESSEAPVEKPEPKPVTESEPSDKTEVEPTEEPLEKIDVKPTEVPLEESLVTLATEKPLVEEEKPQETPEEKPFEAPKEKPQETPEEKPYESPEERPQEVPEEKPLEVPEEKPQETPEEKPLEEPEQASPEEKPQEMPEGIPSAAPEEKPTEVPEEKSTEAPKEKPEAAPEEKPQEASEEKPQDTPEEKPLEAPEEKPEEVTEEKPQETPDEKPQEAAEEKPTETSEEKLEGATEETPQETPEGKPQEAPEDKPLEEPEATEETPQGVPDEKPQELPVESPQEVPEERPQEAPEEKPQEIPKEKPQEVPEAPEEKPQEEPVTTEETLQGVPEEKPQELPVETPQASPEEKPLDTPEEKPQEVPEEKPLGTPEEKPQEASEEEPQEAPEEKPEEETKEKPQETPEEKPQEVPEEKPQEASEEKPHVEPEAPEEKPQEMPEEKPQETLEDKPLEAPVEKTQEEPEEKPEETLEKKPQEVPEDKPQEEPEEKPEGATEETPQETPEEKPQEVPEEKPLAVPEEKPQEVPETPDEKPQEVPEEQPQETPEEKPEEAPEEKPQEMPETPEEKPQEVPEEKPQEVPGAPEEKPQEVPEEKPQEVPEEKPQEVPEEKPQEVPEEKPQEIPEEKPQEVPEEKPQGTPEEKPQEVPEEKPQETPEEKPQEVPKEKPQEIPEEKPTEPASTATPEISKPSFTDMQPTDEVPDDDSQFPSSGGTSGYGTEPDYVEEDQAFGPGTCRYGGKVYVSAQQIPRDDPCDFCFCFRSDIICLQQSCPPPIHGCHEEPIQGFCCPRYECPVAMATTLNVTTTTTTTTTTLPPHFLPHAYKGAAQRRGCQIKGHTYKVGEVVRASSGPCLHCTCGGDGQMKCDPKACTPEPMLRQMIAAAVSAKRRR